MAAAWTSAQGFISTHARLASLKDMLTSSSFTADGYVGLGVPLGTDAFVQKLRRSEVLQRWMPEEGLEPLGQGRLPGEGTAQGYLRAAQEMAPRRKGA
jgi:hypothetical protein